MELNNLDKEVVRIKEENSKLSTILFILGIVLSFLIVLSCLIAGLFMTTKQTAKTENSVKAVWEERCEHLSKWLLCGDGNSYKVGTDEEINARFEDTFGILELVLQLDKNYNRMAFIYALQELERSNRMPEEMEKMKGLIIEYHVEAGK